MYSDTNTKKKIERYSENKLFHLNFQGKCKAGLMDNIMNESFNYRKTTTAIADFPS